MATIFTRIINGEIPCHRVAEDEHHFAFLDINPVAEGHTLVVPKEEVDYFFDLPDHRIHEMMDFSRAVASALDRSLEPIRTGVIIQGLEVPHAHIHLIPLYSTGQEMSLGAKVEVSEKRMKELSDTIQKAVHL